MNDALLPVAIMCALLIIWCLIGIIRHPVRHLPKWAWILIVVCFIPLGPILYLVVGQARRDDLTDEDLR